MLGPQMINLTVSPHTAKELLSTLYNVNDNYAFFGDERLRENAETWRSVCELRELIKQLEVGLGVEDEET